MSTLITGIYRYIINVIMSIFNSILKELKGESHTIEKWRFNQSVHGDVNNARAQDFPSRLEIHAPEKVQEVLREIGLQDKKWSNTWTKRINAIITEQIDQDDHEQSAIPLLTINGIITEFVELCSELNSQNNEYLREIVDICDAYSKECVKSFTSKYEEESLFFLDGQFDMIRKDIDYGYKAYTGLLDSMKHILKKVVDLDQFDSLIEKSYSKHLGQEIILSFNDGVLQCLSDDIDKGWDKIIRQTNKRHSIINSGSTPYSSLDSINTPEHTYDTASIVSGAGIATVAISTAVLTAGWHTLAWTIGGLTVWALPAVIFFSGLFALIRKDKEKAKLLERINEHEMFVKKALSDNIKYRVRNEIQTLVENKSNSIKKALFKNRFGSFDYELLKKLLFAMEEYIEKMRSFAWDEPNDGTKQASTDWMVQARNQMENENDITAAIYASFGFEDLLRQINWKKKIGFNFRQEGHNYAFIEHLLDLNIINGDLYSRMQSLRDRRNFFIHRIHIHAVRNKNRRMKDVERFIEDIEKMKRTVTG